MQQKRKKIGIITMPLNDGALIPLSNLIDVVKASDNTVSVITTNKGKKLQNSNINLYTLSIPYDTKVNIIYKIIYYIYLQISISYYIINLVNKVDIWIFFLDSHSLTIPVLTAKTLNKKILFTLSASINQSKGGQRLPIRIALYTLAMFESFNFHLCDFIILYSPALIEQWNLEKYRNKILIAHKHFVDFSKYYITNNEKDKDNIVGYVGRLSEEKGIINLINAIPLILKKLPTTRFIIVGDGRLYEEVNNFLKRNNLTNNVDLIGWVPHDELPNYLNKMKMIVMPSYSEGLPNVILEAMACGVPVLATPVGSIPDLIIESNTGFIMDDNSPEGITSNVIRVIGYDDLDTIALNARKFVNSEYSFESAVNEYKKIFSII